MLKRFRAQEEAEEFVSNLRKNAEFDALYTQINEKKLEYLKISLEKEKLKLKTEVENLQQKIDLFLKNNKIDSKKLSPQYECKLCEDTGIYNGKICSCLQKELNKKISEQTSCQAEFKSFASCDFSIMDETDVKAFKLLKTWCEKFPDVTKYNINIVGGAGSGKTYLLECVANELVRNGIVVSYVTAFELNELARLYHIGKSYDFSDYMSADVLLIDDLGTEPVLKNVTKEYFYNLINIRQLNKKPTLITTNLSLEDILNRYDDRIFSRLGNKRLSINIKLTSQDKRIK